MKAATQPGVDRTAHPKRSQGLPGHGDSTATGNQGGNAQIRVFIDPDVNPEQGLVAGSDEVEWNALATEAARTKENTDDATMWTNVKMKAKNHAQPHAPSFPLFVDEGMVAAAEQKEKAAAQQEEQQQRVAPSFRSPGRLATEAEKLTQDHKRVRLHKHMKLPSQGRGQLRTGHICLDQLPHVVAKLAFG